MRALHSLTLGHSSSTFAPLGFSQTSFFVYDFEEERFVQRLELNQLLL